MTRALLLALLTLLPAAVRAEDPHVDYLLQCQGCHLSDGTGKPGAVPSLAGRMACFTVVPGGREFLVRVPGSASSALSDDALARVLNWMLARFGPAALARDAPPFTGAEVAAVRHPPLEDVEGERRRLVAALASPEVRARLPDGTCRDGR